jgi:preprotein translocase subunit SecG
MRLLIFRGVGMDKALADLMALLAIGFFISIPFLKQRAKENRLRREWRARGLGYAEGKHAIVGRMVGEKWPQPPAPPPPADPAAPIVPYGVHNATGFKWLTLAGMVVVLSLIGWVLYQVDTPHSSPAGGVSLTTGVHASGRAPDLSRCGGTVESCLQEAECVGMNAGRYPYFGGQAPVQCRDSVKRWVAAKKHPAKQIVTPR